MPVSHPPVRAHPGKPFRTWSDAARDRQVVTIRCNGCRRSENFLAEDFALVFGPEQPVHIPPFACSRCGTQGLSRSGAPGAFGGGLRYAHGPQAGQACPALDLADVPD